VREAEVERRGQSRPNRGGKLSTSVGSYSSRNPKTGKPTMQQGLSAGRSSGGGQRNGLRPAGHPVHNSHQMGKTPRGGQGNHQVHVDVEESA